MHGYMKAKYYPVHAAWPMGLAPSASMVQGFAYQRMAAVDTSGVGRVRCGDIAPAAFPRWTIYGR